MLVAELQAAETRGLLTSDYDGGLLKHRADGLSSTSARDIARLDLSFSVAAARLASDLHVGRVKPSDFGYDLDIERPAFDAIQVVTALASSSEVSATLDSMEPQLRHYALLKAALARYRSLARTGGELTRLHALPRARIRPGEDYVHAPALRRLLEALGDLPAAEARATADVLSMDPVLVGALQRFQSRHGLDADGVLGRATFSALTTPLSARIQQIELSMERVRWLPPRLEAPPLIVNIPQFRLFAFRTTEDNPDDILQMDVIVGETFRGRRTPVFAADMRYVVLNPYWDVPRSILLKELMPDIRADSGWIERHGYEIVRGESDEARPLPATSRSIDFLAKGSARLRQKPGASNALGRVKFMFPNRHSVYLHDTPARALFARSRRAFSHGCIRVSDPMTLLAHVMRDDPTWTAERRDALLASGKPVRIPLARPIRVFILYGTSLVTEADGVLFFDDIYGQDAPLIQRLAARRNH
jgi:murein L,D-transpeptidase YcbB/YkuD